MPPKGTGKTPSRRGSRAPSEPPQTPTPVPRTTATRGGRTPSVTAATPTVGTTARTRGDRPTYSGIGAHGQPLTYQSPQTVRPQTRTLPLTTIAEVNHGGEGDESGDDTDDDNGRVKKGRSPPAYIDDSEPSEEDEPIHSADGSYVGSIAGSDHTDSSEYDPPFVTPPPPQPRSLGPVNAFNYLVHGVPYHGYGTPGSRGLHSGARRPSANTPNTSNVPPPPPPPPAPFSGRRRRPNPTVLGRMPFPDDDPSDDGAAIVAGPRSPSWWSFFKAEALRGLGYLHPEHILRWTIVLTAEFFLLKGMLCSAGPICKTHRFKDILLAYLWGDTWYVTVDFWSRLVLFALLLSELYDFVRGLDAFVASIRNEGTVIDMRNSLEVIWRSIQRDCWEIFRTFCDTSLEPMLLFVLTLIFNKVIGNGNALVACGFMLLMHVAMWVVVATDRWDRAKPYPFVPTTRGLYMQPWKRLCGIAVLAVLIVTFVVYYYYHIPAEADEWLKGGIRHRDPTPTEARYPVFNVTRITSVTGDFTAALNAILSASGLSPITTG